ncbi:hypothetical protein [Paenibacillus gallinarum]|uniref:Lipoprotein n=1 Tax=Paenibacillus gallinarum TaxID=2762232 RepID=A0ABR8T5H3_9BACL|nr:hypothetical protein [Paenibacillus gallinarum]MBD7971002.1 hypothetical protein [Paenibacillus gallinarum]
MKKILCTLLLLFLLITGCSTDHSDSNMVNNTELAKGVKQKTEMPLKMPTDFNFMVSFGYGEVTKNVIDTYTGTVTKDLITQGSATANIIFTTDELREIYDKMKTIDIMGPKKSSKEEGCFKTPSNEDKWKITVDGETKIFSWTDQNCRMTEDANQLLELRIYIQQMAQESEAYKSLPEAEGGYD